jgi:hypothetical protein
MTCLLLCGPFTNGEKSFLSVDVLFLFFCERIFSIFGDFLSAAGVVFCALKKQTVMVSAISVKWV